MRDGGVNFYVLLQLLQALFVNHERETEQELIQVPGTTFLSFEGHSSTLSDTHTGTHTITHGRHSCINKY